MLQAPTSETRNDSTRSKVQQTAAPVQERYPLLADVAGPGAPTSAYGATLMRSSSLSTAGKQNLQAAYGNQAALRMLNSPQQVARMIPLRPSQGMMLQRKCACGGSSESEGECAECKAKSEETLWRSAANPAAPATVPPIVHDVLGSSGHPLDAGTRAFMEPRFGHDFSGVRVHTDARAAESARAVNALAYTVGSNVVFGEGQHQPETSEGKRLMAHELTHVVQQYKNTENPLQTLSLGRSDDIAEQEANTSASIVQVGGFIASSTRQTTSTANIIRRFEVSERSRITNLDAVIETAHQIAQDRGAVGLMRWGRFTAGIGGFGAIEAISTSLGSLTHGLRNRYLFTCRCGLVDMRHFYQLAYLALVPFGGGNRGATERGREHERTGEATSRFAPEDIPSNALGAYFGTQQSWVERQSVFTENLRNYLQQCKVIDFTTLSPADQDTIVNYYGSRDASGKPAAPNETATPAILSVAACASEDRTFPFVIDPTDPNHETISGVAPISAPAPPNAAPEPEPRDAGVSLPGGVPTEQDQDAGT